MKYSILIRNKRMIVEVSEKAKKELMLRHKPVVAVVHLIFGCMVAKRVWFKEEPVENAVVLTNQLSVTFDVVKYANCSLSNIDSGAKPESYPLKNDIKKYVPDYLFIDMVKKELLGNFTFLEEEHIEKLHKEGFYELQV